MKRSVFLGVVILLVGCVSKDVEVPDGLIPAETFTAIMIDVQLREGIVSHTGTYRDVRSEALQTTNPYSAIYEKHGVSAGEFRSTYEFYRHNPAFMEGIYEQVLDSLSKLEAEVKQRFTREERARSDSIQKATQRKNDSIRGLLRPAQIPAK